jgi:hypothetical protein
MTGHLFLLKISVDAPLRLDNDRMTTTLNSCYTQTQGAATFSMMALSITTFGITFKKLDTA